MTTRAKLAGLRVDLALMRPSNRRPAPKPVRGLTRADLRRAGLRFVWDVLWGIVRQLPALILKIGPKYERGFFG